MKNIIEVNNLTKKYPGFTLSQASFTVPEGCITGFVGANGAGKTTTLRAILGLLQPDGGEIRLFGKQCPLHPGTASDFQRNLLADRIGVVLGAGAFYENLTIRQMKQAIAPAYSSWQEDEFRKLSKRFGLEPSRKIKTLSSGTKMKLALALALSHNAELLIMDEPTGGLDPLVRDTFLTLLREFMEKGAAACFFPHISPPIWINAQTILFLSIMEKSCWRRIRTRFWTAGAWSKVTVPHLHRKRKPFCAVCGLPISASQQSPISRRKRDSFFRKHCLTVLAWMTS